MITQYLLNINKSATVAKAKNFPQLNKAQIAPHTFFVKALFHYIKSCDIYTEH